MEKRFKAASVCVAILLLGYVSVWLATLASLAVLLPVLQVFQTKRSARHAVESVDKLLYGRRFAVPDSAWRRAGATAIKGEELIKSEKP